MPETRHYCPHCEETVSLSTFRRHKLLYYDEDSHTWNKNYEVLSDSDGDGENEQGLGQEDMNHPLFSDGSLSDRSDEGIYSSVTGCWACAFIAKLCAEPSLVCGMFNGPVVTDPCLH